MIKTPKKAPAKAPKARTANAPAQVSKPAPKPKKKGKHPGGRPTVITPDVLLKLERAYCGRASHAEAAAYADISESALYAYLKAKPEFSKRIEGLKGRTKLLAKLVVLEEVEKGNLAVALDVLERGQEPGYQKVQEQAKAGTNGVQVNILPPGQTPEGQAAINVLHAILSGGRVPIAGHQGEGE